MKTTFCTIVTLFLAAGSAFASPAGAPAPAPEIGSGLVGGGVIVAGLLFAAAITKFRRRASQH